MFVLRTVLIFKKICNILIPLSIKHRNCLKIKIWFQWNLLRYDVQNYVGLENIFNFMCCWYVVSCFRWNCKVSSEVFPNFKVSLTRTKKGFLFVFNIIYLSDTPWNIFSLSESTDIIYCLLDVANGSLTDCLSLWILHIHKWLTGSWDRQRTANNFCLKI